MTAVSGTREGKARGPGGGLPEPLCQRRHLYVETVTGPETDGSNRTRHRKDTGGEKNKKATGVKIYTRDEAEGCIYSEERQGSSHRRGFVGAGGVRAGGGKSVGDA